MHLWIGCMVIRASRDQRAFDHFPGLIAVFHALLRLLAPRHPPHALSSLAALILSSARVATHLEPIASSYPAQAWPGPSNDPFSLRAHAESRKKLQRERLAPLTLRSCDCNS